MIEFNSPYHSGNEVKYIEQAVVNGALQAGGLFDEPIKAFLKKTLSVERVMLVHSCTAALEIAALAIEVKEGDEVIMPSYTYVSTANAFALRGASIKFVDVDPRTMCLDLDAVECALTDATKVVVPVHYGSASCDMDRLMALSEKYDFWVVEDAAQALYGYYKDQALGTIGHFGCISCHETKNIHAGGEGGLLFVKDNQILSKVAQIIEKGTNRQAFLEDRVSKYTWQSLGSSYGMSSLHSAYLYGQLERYQEIKAHRRRLFNAYVECLRPLENKGLSNFCLPNQNDGNGHLYYIKTKTTALRTQLTTYLKEHDVQAVSHYEPLHLAPAGKEFGDFIGQDRYTSKGASCLLRLPLHMNLTVEEVGVICQLIKEFYQENTC